LSSSHDLKQLSEEEEQQIDWLKAKRTANWHNASYLVLYLGLALFALVLFKLAFFGYFFTALAVGLLVVIWERPRQPRQLGP